jgi:glycosyltransferase involved in cell wall biosynthesis
LNKLNVLFVIPQLEKGGSETLVYNIASHLNRSMFDVSVAYFNYYGNDAFREEFLQHNIKLHHIPRINESPFSTMLKMAKIIRENEINVVNAHHFISMINSFYACKIANHSALVYTEHSSWEVENVTLKWRVMGRLLLSQLDCVMGISEDVTQSLRKKYHLRRENALTIRNGVDLDNKTTARDNRSIRNELGLADNIKVVATVANFRKVKNHLLLLQGYRELLKELADVKLLLIGQGHINDSENSENEIRDFIVENNMSDRVILTGHRSDVKDLLSIADAFCLTSFKEGLPISMLEAMSIGLPVVGTNVPGIRDVIIHGQNGFLVDLGEYMGLKEALFKILSNKQLGLKYGQESRKIVIDLYSMNDCVKRYQELFLRLMHRSERGTMPEGDLKRYKL